MNNSKFCISNLAILALFMALSLQATIVLWWGKGCVLEKTVTRRRRRIHMSGIGDYGSEEIKEHRVETDKCVRRCGLDRNTLGISSDSLLDTCFTRNLCSSRCYNHCPNIVHLFTNLAAAEGLSLPKLCNAQGGNVRKEISNIRSSGIVASGPIQSASTSIPPNVAQEPLQFHSMSFAPAVAPATNGV